MSATNNTSEVANAPQFEIPDTQSLLVVESSNNYRKHYNNNNTSQCGSCFCGIWRDPDTGNLTSTNIPAGRETDSKRLSKASENHVYSIAPYC